MDAADKTGETTGPTDESAAPTPGSERPQVTDLEVHAFQEALAAAIAERGPFALHEGLRNFPPPAVLDLFFGHPFGGRGFGGRGFGGPGFGFSGPVRFLDDEVVRQALAQSRQAEAEGQRLKEERERQLAAVNAEITALVEQQREQGLDVYVALDRSGSARNDLVCKQQVELVHELQRLLGVVTPLQVFGFSTCGDKAEIYPIKGFADEPVELDWHQLYDLGGQATPTEAAVAYVRDQIDGREAGERLLLIVTDGDPTAGPKIVVEQIEAARREGIRVYGLHQDDGPTRELSTVFGDGNWAQLPHLRRRRDRSVTEERPLVLCLADALKGALSGVQTARKLPLTDYAVVTAEQAAQAAARRDPHPGRMKTVGRSGPDSTLRAR